MLHLNFKIKLGILYCYLLHLGNPNEAIEKLKENLITLPSPHLVEDWLFKKKKNLHT